MYGNQKMIKKEIDFEMRKAVSKIDGNQETIIKLLGTGANPNVTDPDSKASILFTVMTEFDELGQSKHEDLFLQFVKHGADVNKRNRSGHSLLSIACLYGLYSFVKILIDAKAKVDTDKDSTFIFLCADSPGWHFFLGSEESEERLKIAELLIDKVDINKFDHRGKTSPLILASDHGWYNLVKLLVANGANVNALSKAGNTALMYACGEVNTISYDGKWIWGPQDSHYQIAQYLVEQGASILVSNNQKRTPLSIALNSKQYNIAVMLVESLSKQNKLTQKVINKFKNTEYYETVKNLPLLKSNLDLMSDDILIKEKMGSWKKAEAIINPSNEKVKSIFTTGVKKKYRKYLFAWWPEQSTLCISIEKTTDTIKPIVTMIDSSGGNMIFRYKINGEIVRELNFGKRIKENKIHEVFIQHLELLLKGYQFNKHRP